MQNVLVLFVSRSFDVAEARVKKEAKAKRKAERKQKAASTASTRTKDSGVDANYKK